VNVLELIDGESAQDHSVNIRQLHNLSALRYLTSYKAGQTEFTVYRHRIFDFACGRTVIIQISN
jgi:hypothetical protein